MKFPTGNRIQRPLEQAMGDNAKLLEEKLSQANWRVIGSYYAVGLVTLLISLFLIICVIRLAFIIF